MATKKQFTQTADQSATRSGAVREALGGTNVTEHINEDLGQRDEITNADHQGHLFNNRKSQEEAVDAIKVQALQNAVSLQAQLNALSVQAVANAQAQANLVNQNAATVNNVANNNTAHNLGRTQAQEERHADLAMDNQWTTQSGVDDDTTIPPKA